MTSAVYGNLPVSNPPPGSISNFDHPQTLAIDIFVGVGVCLGLAFAFVLLRLYVRLAVTRTWGWDDLACVVGFGLIIVFAAVTFSLTGPKKFLGKHAWDTRLSSLTKGFFQSILATVNVFCASAFFVKLSLLLLYLRLFNPDKVTRWLVYGGIFVTGVFYSANIVYNIVIYMPSHGQPHDTAGWTLRAHEKLQAMKTLAVSQSVFGTISDIYLLVIPIRSIFRLQLPIQRKFGVSSIFMIGILAISCSIVSLVYRVKFLGIEDSLWFSAPISVFSTAEISAGIICSCMPILKVLFRGDATKRSPFTFFAALWTRFSVRGFRQQFSSKQTQSSDTLSPDELYNRLGLEGKLGDSDRLNHGIRRSNSNEVV